MRTFIAGIGMLAGGLGMMFGSGPELAASVGLAGSILMVCGIVGIIYGLRDWHEARKQREPQPKTKRRKGWFWTGVGLLLGTPFWWLVFADVMLGKEGEAPELLIGAPILTGVGIFCIMRSRKPRVVEGEAMEPIYETEILEKAGGTVEVTPDTAISAPPGRKVTVDEQIGSRSLWELKTYTYTRVFVDHMGKIPCIIELPLSYSPKTWVVWGIVWLCASGGNFGLFADLRDVFWLIPASIFMGLGIFFIRRGRKIKAKGFLILDRAKFYDKDVYVEWRKKAWAPYLEGIPKRARILGSKVPTTMPEQSIPVAREWVREIFDVPNISALQSRADFDPFLRVEPNQIVWLRRKGKTEEIEKAKQVLVSIAEKIEKY